MLISKLKTLFKKKQNEQPTINSEGVIVDNLENQEEPKPLDKKSKWILIIEKVIKILSLILRFIKR